MSLGNITPEQQFERIATRLGLTEEEKVACRAAIREKTAAAKALNKDINALGMIVLDQTASDEQLSTAFDKYEKALTAYREQVKRIDSELLTKLSPRAKVGMMIVGVLDNGLRALGGGGAIGVKGLVGNVQPPRGVAPGAAPSPAPSQ
jgi:hypothetical protein